MASSAFLFAFTNADYNSTTNDRDIFFENTVSSRMADQWGIGRCTGEDNCVGAICTRSYANNCSKQSKCTCLEFGAPYMDDLAQCLGLTEVTPQVWLDLPQSELDQPCVGITLEPHLIPADM